MYDDDESVIEQTEAQRIEVWKAQQLMRWGFSSDQIDTAILWNVDLHDLEQLLYRDGKRTDCTIEQALRILEPVPA